MPDGACDIIDRVEFRKQGVVLHLRIEESAGQKDALHFRVHKEDSGPAGLYAAGDQELLD
jgi:hypothetical protein